jgi:hypothetical protein
MEENLAEYDQETDMINMVLYGKERSHDDVSTFHDGIRNKYPFNGSQKDIPFFIDIEQIT